MTRQQAARLVAAISAAHPRTKVPDETVAVYAKLLEDIPYETGEQAVTDVLKTVPYWPSVAEIRERCVWVANRRHEGRELERPEMSEEERAGNLAQVRQLLAKLNGAQAG